MEWSSLQKAGEIFETTATCNKHGEFQTSGRILFGSTHHISGCPKCEQEKDLLIREKNRERNELKKQRQIEESIRQEEEKKKLVIEQYLSSVPQRFKDCCINTFVCDSKGKEIAKSTMDNFWRNFNKLYGKIGTNLLFHGKVGTGKTHLGVGTGKKIAELGFTSYYRDLPGLFSDIRRNYSDRSSSDWEMIQSLTSYDFLILDEIGSTKNSEWEQATLFQIMNSRYANMKSTLVITNLTLVELSSLFGERLMSRLLDEDSMSFNVFFNWGDYRRREKSIQKDLKVLK